MSGEDRVSPATTLLTFHSRCPLPSFPRSFPSHREADPESALLHYRARSYDPRVGRFIQRDPPIGFRVEKHYVYALNNPVRYIDPLGKNEVADNLWVEVLFEMKKEGLTADQAGQEAASRLKASLERQNFKNVACNVGVEDAGNGQLKVVSINGKTPEPGRLGDIDIMKFKDGAKVPRPGDVISYGDVEWWKRTTISDKEHVNAKLEQMLEAGTKKKGTGLQGFVRWAAWGAIVAGALNVLDFGDKTREGLLFAYKSKFYRNALKAAAQGDAKGAKVAMIGLLEGIGRLPSMASIGQQRLIEVARLNLNSVMDKAVSETQKILRETKDDD
jgi:RHS repeat-associated protein